ncbi:hypothetical protein HA62_11415 [Pseudomonas putida]|nr:hypothetical protein HA62_11415 [Pseudomonas putida]
MVSLLPQIYYLLLKASSLFPAEFFLNFRWLVCCAIIGKPVLYFRNEFGEARLFERGWIKSCFAGDVILRNR